MWTCCDSCGMAVRSAFFAGSFFPDIDWTMCYSCQRDGRLSEFTAPGLGHSARPNVYA